jgi:hypothetical protein
METIEFLGGAERDRTADLLVANEALSQLSYSPTPCTSSAEHAIYNPLSLTGVPL